MLRGRLVLFGIGGSLVVGLPIQACGSTDPTAAPTDAGSGADGADAADAEGGCGASIVNIEAIPDASIADGATTSGICLGCVNTRCQRFVSECNASCDCQTIVGRALECFVRTSSPTACAAPLVSGNVDPDTRRIGVGLVLCVNSFCSPECAVTSFVRDAGEDAGEDAGDTDQ